MFRRGEEEGVSLLDMRNFSFYLKLLPWFHFLNEANQEIVTRWEMNGKSRISHAILPCYIVQRALGKSRLEIYIPSFIKINLNFQQGKG